MNGISLLIFAIFSIPIAARDIKELMVPDWAVFSGSAVLAAYMAIFCRELLLFGLIGAILSPLLFYAVRRCTNFGMGLGDVKYSVFCGLCAGATKAFVSYAAASLFCAIYFAACYILRKKSGRERKIPFAPFMALGLLAVCGLSLIIW